MNIKNQRDFFSGLLFMATGAGFAWTASHYAIGNALRMGPGYFPLLVGALLVVLGSVLVFKALVLETEDGGRLGRWGWRPLLGITTATLMLPALIVRLSVGG